MIKIVGIGANVYDTLITLPEFPAEDTKMRANSTCVSGGGPCATGLVTASKLGGSSAFIGVLSDDNAGKFLLEDMKKYGMTDEYVDVKKGYSSFSSYILLNTKKASRTCVFNKGNLPALELSEKQKQVICDAEILMVDGNEMESAIEGAKLANQSDTKVLDDAGGLYDGVERLLPYADILIPSEEFALGHTDKKTADEAAIVLYKKYSPEVVVITQGKNGGIIYDGKEIAKYPAFLVDAVDSNGSGDVFHGAFAFAVSIGYNYKKACVFSSAVSALKCTKVGSRASIPTLDEVKKFLKERGCNEFEENME